MFPFNCCPRVGWHLGGIWQWQNECISVMGYFSSFMSLPALPDSFSPLHLVWCLKRLTCVGSINELQCPQLLVGLGSGSSGNRWKRERRMRSGCSLGCPSCSVLLVCWLSPSAEGLNSGQLHTAFLNLWVLPVRPRAVSVSYHS